MVVLVSVFWRDEYSLEYMPGNSLVLYTCLSQALENVVTLFPKSYCFLLLLAISESSSVSTF